MEFVIQEHRAKRAGLHHDFRLEVGDMLESWVIPKGVIKDWQLRPLTILLTIRGLRGKLRKDMVREMLLYLIVGDIFQ